MNFIVEKILYLLLATFLGAIVGFSREKKGKNAGLKTNSIVSLSSCLLTMVASQYGDEGVMRVAAQITCGIGFLGAGVILVRDSKPESTTKIQGLTSAATIWFCAAVGIVTPLRNGAFLAIASVLIYLFISFAFAAIEKIMRKNSD